MPCRTAVRLSPVRAGAALPGARIGLLGAGLSSVLRSRGRLSRLRRLGLLLWLWLFSVTLEPDFRFGSSRGVLLLCLRMDSALRLRPGLRVRLLLFRLERSRDFFCFS